MNEEDLKNLKVTSENVNEIARYVLNNNIPLDSSIVKKIHHWFKDSARESSYENKRTWNIKLAQRFYDNGMNIERIAKSVGTSESTIRNSIWKGDIKDEKRKALIAKQKAEVDSVKYELYKTGVVEKVGTINEIANYLGFKRTTVKNYLRRYSAVGYNLRKAK